MSWPKKYFQDQAEIILNNFDLTSEEVNSIVEEWNEEINSIPELWYTNLPPDFEEKHALAALQRIAINHVRRRLGE